MKNNCTKGRIVMDENARQQPQHCSRSKMTPKWGNRMREGLTANACNSISDCQFNSDCQTTTKYSGTCSIVAKLAQSSGGVITLGALPG